MEEYHFSLDITPGGAPPVVHADQFDNLGRTLVITLTDGGTAFTPTQTVAAAYLYARLADGTQIALAGSYNSGVVTVSLTAKLTAAAGRAVCIVCLTGAGDVVLGSAPFLLAVRENPCDPGKIVVSDDFRDAVSGWAASHSDLLAQLYGEALTAIANLTDGYMPENMLPWPTLSSSGIISSGVTFTILADGGIRCAGTPVGTAGFYFSGNLDSGLRSLPAGDYTLSGGVSDDFCVTAANEAGTKYVCAGASAVRFASEEGERWCIRILIRRAAGTVDSTIYPVLSRGGTAQAFTHPKYARANLLHRIEKLESV